MSAFATKDGPTFRGSGQPAASPTARDTLDSNAVPSGTAMDVVDEVVDVTEKCRAAEQKQLENDAIDLRDDPADLTIEQLVGLEKKKNEARKNTPWYRRNAKFQSWCREKFHGTVPMNLLCFWLLMGQMGSVLEMERLLREKFLFFSRRAEAFLYFVIQGILPLDDVSVPTPPVDIVVSKRLYAHRQLKDWAARLRQSITISPPLTTEEACGCFQTTHGRPQNLWRADVSTPRRRRIPDSVWLKNILPFLCGDGTYSKKIITEDRFSLMPSGLRDPLVLFQYKNNMFCYESNKKSFSKIALPNKKKYDHIPRNAVDDENKETTVLSFFIKGKRTIAQSIEEHSPFAYMRALVYFFIFSALKNRAVSGIRLTLQFRLFADRFENVSHVLYWVILCQELFKSLRESETNPWAERLVTRITGNISKVNSFDVNKQQFGTHYRRQEGVIVFVVSFRVENHPISGRRWIQFGVKLLPNDLERTSRLTLGNALREWLRQFWQHPISLLFDHTVPSASESGLPVFSLMERWRVHHDCHLAGTTIHRHRECLLDEQIQGLDTKFLLKFEKREREIPARIYLRFANYRANETIIANYGDNLEQVLSNYYNRNNLTPFEELKSNGLEHGFDNLAFDFDENSTVADFAENSRRQIIGVPSKRLAEVMNIAPYSRNSERYNVPYGEPLKEWIRKTFPWLEEWGVFDQAVCGGFSMTDDTTFGDYARQCDRGDRYSSSARITLPQIYTLCVENGRPFYGNRDKQNVEIHYNSLLAEVVADIVSRNPLLNKDAVFTNYEGKVFPHTETSTMKDLCDFTRWPNLCFNKVVQKITDTKRCQRTERLSDAKGSCIAMAQLITSKLGISFVQAKCPAGKYVFKRDYMFTTKQPTDHMVSLLKLLFVFVYSLSPCWVYEEITFPIEKDKRKRPTIHLLDVNAQKREKLMVEAAPSASNTPRHKVVQTLLKWCDELTGEGKKVIERFLNCIPLQTAEETQNDELDSPFDLCVRETANVIKRTGNSSCYNRYDYSDSRQSHLIVTGSPNYSWSAYNKKRPVWQFVPMTIETFDCGFVPVEMLSKETMAAYLVSKIRGAGYTTVPVLDGLVFKATTPYAVTQTNSVFDTMASLLSEDRTLIRDAYRARQEDLACDLKTVTRNVRYYFVYPDSKGNNRTLPYETGHAFLLSRKQANGVKKTPDYEARDPTVSKPWQRYRIINDGRFYTIANVYSEPVEAQWRTMTEKQRQTLVKRAKANAEKKTTKKRKATSSSGSSGSKKRKELSSSRAAIEATVRELGAKFGITDPDELERMRKLMMKK